MNDTILPPARWQQMSTDERVQAIKRVWQPNYSASDIASALTKRHAEGGGVVTRNAIIGLYFRQSKRALRNQNPDPFMDHPLRTVTPSVFSRRADSGPKNTKAPRTPRKTQRDPVIDLTPSFIPRYASLPQVIETADEGYGVPLCETTGCRWPTGEVNGSHIFCNREVIVEYVNVMRRPEKRTRSYCATHQRRSITGVTAQQALR